MNSELTKWEDSSILKIELMAKADVICEWPRTVSDIDTMNMKALIETDCLTDLFCDDGGLPGGGVVLEVLLQQRVLGARRPRHLARQLPRLLPHRRLLHRSYPLLKPAKLASDCDGAP